MAKNIIYNDTAKEVIFAVGANYSSGDYIADGGKGGISLNDVASGDDAVVAARCVVEGYPKAAGETWGEGDLLYFDAASNEFTTTEQADGLYRGKAYKAALLDATTGDVEIIDPIPDDIFEASEIPYDNSTSALAATSVQDAIDEVDGNLDNLTAASVAYDNSTSGLVAADVQDAIDEVEGRVDTVETDKMDLVAAPVAGDLMEMDATGQGVPSGLATADVQVLTVPTAANNIATLDAGGAVQDSTTNISVLTGIAGTLRDNARNSTVTAQSLADSTATDIALEDVEVAGDVTVDVTNKEFTIPTTGLYALAFSLTFATAAGGTNRIAEIIVNGSVVAGGEETPSGTGPDVVTDYAILFLTAADVVKLSGWQDSGGALDVTSAYLAIQRMQ